MRIYWFVCILAVCTIHQLHSQTFSVFGTDVSQFPKVKAKFIALSDQGTVMRPDVGDIRVSENGAPRTVTDIRCGNVTSRAISSVILTAISHSTVSTVQGQSNLDIAKATCTKWVNGLNASSECAVVAVDSKASVYSDFLKNKGDVRQACNAITAGSTMDFNEAFLSANGGAFYIHKKARYNRVIVLITDGRQVADIQAQEIVAQARTMQCTIYCFVLGSIASNSLKTIVQQTGGSCYNSITSVQDAEKIVTQILAREQYTNHCEVTWNSCYSMGDTLRNAVVLYRNMGMSDEVEYTTNGQKSFGVYTTPSGTLEFKNLTIGTVKQNTFTLRADGIPVVVTSATSSNPKFAISPDTFIVPAGGSATVTVSYTPSDVGYEFAEFTLQCNLCSPIKLFAAGASGNGIPSTSTLRITSPNGGEKLLGGTSTVITWTGIAATDTVQLEYSTNNGTNWNIITDQATGLQHEWKNIPAVTSAQCLLRITQVAAPGINSSYLTLLHPDKSISNGELSPDGTNAVTCSGDATYQWSTQDGSLLRTYKTISSQSSVLARYNHAGTVVATTSKDNTVRFWDTQTGKEVKQLQIPNCTWSLLAEWSADDKFIAISVIQNQIPTIKVYNSSTYAEVFSADGTTYNFSSISKFGFNSTSDKLITINDKNVVDIWSITSGSKLGGYFGCSDFAINTNTNVLYLAKADSIEEIDANVGIQKRILRCGRPTSKLTISPDNSLLASVYNNANNTSVNDVLVYQTSTGNRYCSVPTKVPFINAVFAKNNAVLAGVANGNAAQTFNLPSGTLQRTYKGHENNITALSISGDASLLLSTSYDYTARIWKNNAPPIQQDVSDAMWDISETKLTVKEITFADTQIETTRDSVINAAITNNGVLPVEVTSIELTNNSSDISIASAQVPYTIMPGKSLSVEILFHPTMVKKYTATLSVRSGDFTQTSLVQGNGIAATFLSEVKTINMGAVKLGEQKDSIEVLSLKNISLLPVVIQSIQNELPNSNDFMVLNASGQITLQPNSVKNIDVRFKPSVVGRTSGRLVIQTNANDIATIVSLYGQGVFSGPVCEATAPEFLSAGCSDTTVDSIRITNTGSSDLTVSDITFQGGNQSNFALLTTFASLTISPSETKSVAVRFTTTTNGTYTTTAIVHNNSTVPQVSLVLTAKKVPIVLDVITQTLQLDTVCYNQPTDIPIVIKNNGTENVIVAFQSSNILPMSPQTITGNKQDTIHLTLAPRTTEGVFSFQISVINALCNTKVNVGVTGAVIEPKFDAANLTMLTLLNTTKTDSFEIRNTSLRTITVTSLPSIAPFTFVNAQVPFTIKPNATYKLAVQYTPTKKDTVTVRGKISADCGKEDEFIITSYVSGALATLDVGNTSGRVGNTINIPIYLRNPVNLEQVGITAIKGYLWYNATMLAPADSTPPGVVQGKYRIIPFSYNIADRNPKTEVLGTMKFKVMLGDSVLTKVYIDSAQAVGGDATLTVYNGVFNVYGLCTQGGTRLFDPFAATQLFLTRPHPVTDGGTTIEFETSEDGQTTLLLTDIFGNTIQRLVDSDLKAGKYNYIFTTENVITGSYWLVLQTATQKSSLRMEVVK